MPNIIEILLFPVIWPTQMTLDALISPIGVGSAIIAVALMWRLLLLPVTHIQHERGRRFGRAMGRLKALRSPGDEDTPEKREELTTHVTRIYAEERITLLSMVGWTMIPVYVLMGVFRALWGDPLLVGPALGGLLPELSDSAASATGGWIVVVMTALCAISAAIIAMRSATSHAQLTGRKRLARLVVLLPLIAIPAAFFIPQSLALAALAGAAWSIPQALIMRRADRRHAAMGAATAQ